jgi:2-dehydropantoate 2-reductase
MKIYIVGVGGIGGYLGGMLARAGNDVAFVCRGENYQAIKDSGLTVESDKSGNFIIKPAQIINDISQIANPDLIFLAVKTYDTRTASQALASVVKPKTIILTFQNGVENDLVIKKLVKAQVFPGAAYIITARVEPGKIKQTGNIVRFVFGDRNQPVNQDLKTIEKIMLQAKIPTEAATDVTAAIWRKFCLITAFSGMTAYYSQPIGPVLKNHRDQYQQCIQETINVGLAEKVNLPANLLQELMTLSDQYQPESKSSLLMDVVNHRPTEIETLNGTVVRLAKKYNISVPINNLIYSAIKND